jgi:hypothetical protein
MTNPIEYTARKAKAALTGVANPADVAAQQDARGGQLVRNMVSGGLALGAGTGAIVALLNYLKSVKEEAALEDEARQNDDTLYIPAVKSAADGGVNRWLAPGLAVTGGILSAGGAYALTQSIYNYLQKKHRQKMLDEAQGEALLASDEEIAKAAATAPAAAKMDFYDLATAFPVAIPLLAAMASGGVAYAALKKTFPTVKSPKSKYPKRIRQVTQDGSVEELPEEDPLAKSAADHVAEADLEAAAMEFLILAVDQASHEKSAAFRVTSDILNRVAKDGIEGVVEIQKAGGLEALVESVRGASDVPADLPNKVLAAAVLCKSARLAPVVSMIASAEFQELAPDLYETALSYGEDHLDKMAGIAPLLQLAYFRPLMLDKSAMSNPLLAQLGQMPGMMPGGPLDPAALAGLDEAALTSDVNGSGAEDSEGEDLGDEDEVARDEDPVDLLFAEQGEASPILDPVGEETEEEELQTAAI